ncbi:N-acetylmuramoyl-L-alanine amidase [Macrococcus equipercicus]|nr:GW dipeptide domain-containing protein [Macrococcus equipercicus]
MDNKFYFKAPALLLMMFAAHSTAAHAAENSTAAENNDSAVNVLPQEITATPQGGNNTVSTPSNVVKTINASDYNNVTTSLPEQSSSAVSTPPDTQTPAAVLTALKTTTAAAPATQAPVTQATAPKAAVIPATGTQAPATAVSTAPKTAAQATAPKATAIPATEIQAPATAVSTAPKTAAQATAPKATAIPATEIQAPATAVSTAAKTVTQDPAPKTAAIPATEIQAPAPAVSSAAKTAAQDPAPKATAIPATETQAPATTVSTAAKTAAQDPAPKAAAIPATEIQAPATTVSSAAETAAQDPAPKTAAIPATETQAPATTVSTAAKTVAQAPVTQATAPKTAEIPVTSTLKTAATKSTAASTKTAAVPSTTAGTSSTVKTTVQPTAVQKSSTAITAGNAVRTFSHQSGSAIAAPKTTLQKTASSMSVNDYIKYMNYNVPVYQQDFSSDFPLIAYRNGVGAPEGVVAHETANNTSTIWGEIAYMKNNFENAFVHAFVDDNNIIETAPTDYLAWGSGQYANPRFIQVELVRVQGKDRFSKAINNYADYIATNLLYYNLPVDSAEYDGTGTLWSHKAVSNYLGGTDHGDPYGWFAENGYTFDELVQLVTEKYNYKTNNVLPTPSTPPVTSPAPVKTGKVTTTAVSKMARINSAATPIYASVTDTVSTPAGAKYSSSYFVNKKAELNGDTYYLIQDDKGNPRGWIESKDLTQATRSTEQQVSTKYTINSLVSGIYSTPWGTDTQKLSDLKTAVNQVFAPSKKVIINSTPYYFGTVNNISGWISGSHLTLQVPAPTNVKAIDMIGRTANGAAYYTDSNISKKAAVNLAATQYYINKEALKGTEKYFQIVDAANKTVGWVSDKDITQTTHQVIDWKKAPYAVTDTKSYVLSIPDGSNTQRVAPLANLSGKVFNVVKTEKVGTSLWYKGVFANTNTVGWIPEKYLTPQPTNVKAIDMIGRTANGAVYYTDNLIYEKAAAKLADKQYYISKEALKGSEKYFQIVDAANKTVGWINDKQITQFAHQTVSWEKAPYVITNVQSYLFSIPGGSTTQRIAPLSKQTSKIFNVVKTEKVGTSLWYKGVFTKTNTVGWIEGKYLTKQLVTIAKAPESLSTAVKKQMNLAATAAPKVIYTDKTGKSMARAATSQEVRNYLNTSSAMNNPAQKYQFLNLNVSQGISGSTLNKLLVGKGILAGQGQTFAEASKLLNINEIYLISHALLETGNGTSELSRGLGYNSKTGQVSKTASKKYYNMYGTKATDSNVYNGTKYAYENGWDTPAKAIIGGAKYVADSYFKNQQFTLHQMRWNPKNTATHQYATDIAWASKNAARIADFYQQIGLEGLKFFVYRYDQ